ncbi:MAG TPA: transketolase family protein [Candidatus Pygmaiobacter gallistercoris]|nr:transketolase family protein [Candidatus Pygmaiobacter gallistercoris]
MAENKVPNKKAICDALVQAAKTDRDIVVLCSDSRGSASFGEFIEQYPDQLVEVGIAEQDLVGVSAGLARCGKKAFAVSPACFLTTRSIEQVKVDVCYSHTNVKLIGISGGISYGALGMSHHSAQDVAYTASLPGMRVYLPSDRFQSYWLVQQLLQDTEPAYLRVGRSAVEDLYDENTAFELNRAKLVQDGTDLGIIACGEMVQQAAAAARILGEQGISCRVVDMYCLKPIDRAQVLETARSVGALLTVEEHVRAGGLGSMVCQILCEEGISLPVRCLTLPDEPVIAGNSAQVFAHYGLDGEGIARKGKELVKE